MKQLPILLTTMLTTITVGFVSPAMAFNLSWGAGAAIVPHTQTTNGADIPTPQFFQVTTGKKSIPLTLPSAPNDNQVSPHLYRIQPQQAKPANTAIHTVQTPAAPIVYHLNGPELFLLKQVQTLAKHQ